MMMIVQVTMVKKGRTRKRMDMKHAIAYDDADDDNGGNRNIKCSCMDDF